MSQHYENKFLWKLRNTISIDLLIKETLELSVKETEGYLRFLCPECHDYHTATMAKTNLARCFRCQINFNPIDLVMVVHDCSFKDAVEYLRGLL